MVIYNDNFVVKSIDRSYVDSVYNVYKRCEDFLALGPVPTASKQMILDDFKTSQYEGGIYCGIFLQNNMIGIVDFILAGYEGNPCHGYISLLMISDDYRGKGIGKAVVSLVEKEISKNPAIKSIFVSVQINNKPGISFWNKAGYKIIRGPEVMPDTTITYTLKKDIC